MLKCERSCPGSVNSLALGSQALAPFWDSSKRETIALVDPFVLTLLGEFVRGDVPRRTVGSGVIVLLPPSFDLGSRIVKGSELGDVQVLVVQAAV